MRRWLVNLAVFFGGGLFALLVAEIVLRFVYYFPQPQFLRTDPFVGHRHRPGVHGYYIEEGFSKYSINSHGIRDREYSLAKPPGVFRIAVLGDSYCEALQVDLEQTFHERLGNSLRGVEVLNFGVSGFGTAQEFLTYRFYARRFAPDLVLLVLCAGNDISDNSRALAGGYPRPYFDLRDGELVLDNSFRQSRRHRVLSRYGPIYYFIADHSAIAEQLDRWRRTAMTRRRAQLGEGGVRQPAGQTVEPGLLRGIYGPPATPELQNAWAVTERLILELQKAAAAEAAQLAVMTVTSAAQVDPGQRAEAERARPDWDLDYPDTRVRQFAEAHGIPCLTLTPAFLEYQQRTGRRLHGFGAHSGGHWNAEGHRLAAKELRRFLEERDLIPGSRE